MIPSKNYVKPTAFEEVRMNAIRESARVEGCILSVLRRAKGLAVPTTGKVDLHHLKDGNKVMGHWYTISLHSWWHRGVPPRGMRAEEAREIYGAALSDGSKLFLESHDLTDRDLWVEQQKRMGMSEAFPVSKIVPRRVA